MDDNKKGTKSSSPVKEFLMAFVHIFELILVPFKIIAKPFKGLFNKTSKKVDEVYQEAKEVVNNQTMDNEAPTLNLDSLNSEKPKQVNLNMSLNEAVTKSAVEVKEDKKEEAEQSTLKKIWAMLNSDMGGGAKTKTLSKSQQAQIDKQREKLNQDLTQDDAKKSSTGKVYLYKALTSGNKIVTGTLYGYSKIDINSYLLNEGYEPFYIENNAWIDLFYGDSSKLSKRRFKNKDLIFFLTQLATYIKSGITLTEAMKILRKQTGKDKNKKGIYDSIVYELTTGSSFSEACSKQGNVFPPLLINMLKAAEATGELEETLDDMVDYYTDIETTRKDMISAITYPTIVTIFAMTVVVFILLYVIPQFSEIYSSMDVKIEGMTAFLLRLSDFLKKYFIFLLAGFIAFIAVLVVVYKKLKSFRKGFQTFLMKLPIVSKIIMYNEMTIFAKTFSSLLRNNVNITESIDILSKITNNEIYKDIMVKTIDNIAVGDRISEAFKDNWAVPDVAYYMIVTGESTGQLAEMMSKVAQYYQEQHRAIISSLKSLIEPIMIVSLAIIVGVIIISVIVPMYNMYDSISFG